jgi:hypothetical protein
VIIVGKDNHMLTNTHDIPAVAIIKEILAVDAGNTKIIRLICTSRDGEVTNEIEFDTIESAADWRREMQGSVQFA